MHNRTEVIYALVGNADVVDLALVPRSDERLPGL